MAEEKRVAEEQVSVEYQMRSVILLRQSRYLAGFYVSPGQTR